MNIKTDSKVAMIQIRGLEKNFGKTVALGGVDLDIYPGTIIGLLGANGSGKSTLLRHMVGLYIEDAGQCRTFGSEARNLAPRQLARIGYVHQDGELLDWMTVAQHIRYVSAYYENWDKELEDEFIKDFDIPLKARVGTLSPGKRQQLAILLAIGFGPELLILDEPAAGLDPIARSRFLDLLLSLIQDPNRTIIISSHILSDVEKVIDHAIILREGALLRDCSFDDLREEFSKIRLSSLDGNLPEELGFKAIGNAQRSDKQAVLTIASESAQELNIKAAKLNCSIDVEPLSLDEIYRIVVTG
jgi:ABC-2 type transport system ATP-binding protein